MGAPRRKCPSCGGLCHFHDTAWVCDRCGDEWDADHGREFNAPGDMYKIRVSQRVLFFLEGTQAWAVRKDPSNVDYVEVVVLAMNGNRRKDGSVVIDVTAEEALELAYRGDDLAVSSADGASYTGMGIGSYEQVDALADMNAGRALTEQVWRVVPNDRLRVIQAGWNR
jgi:hypothetical protein